MTVTIWHISGKRREIAQGAGARHHRFETVVATRLIRGQPPLPPRHEHLDDLSAKLGGAFGPRQHADDQRLRFVEDVATLVRPAATSPREFRRTVRLNSVLLEFSRTVRFNSVLLEFVRTVRINSFYATFHE